MPRSQFISSAISDLETHLSKYSAQHTLALSLSTETYTLVDSLLQLLKNGAKVKSQSTADIGGNAKVHLQNIDYSSAIVYLETRIESVRQDVGVACTVCERRVSLWNLSIQFNQLEPDVDKVSNFCGYVKF